MRKKRDPLVEIIEVPGIELKILKLHWHVYRFWCDYLLTDGRDSSKYDDRLLREIYIDCIRAITNEEIVLGNNTRMNYLLFAPKYLYIWPNTGRGEAFEKGIICWATSHLWRDTEKETA